MKEKKNGFKYFMICKTIINTILVVLIVSYLSVVLLQRLSGNKSLLGLRVFNVATASMTPVYKVNDIIAVKDCDSSTLKVGDDIAYKGLEGSLAGKIITHRIVDIKKENNETVITTKGVANNIADPPIKTNQILGKAVGKIPVVSFINKVISTQAGFFIVVFCPIVILASLEIAETVIQNKIDKKELIEEL